jgi:hypothetical protein
MNVAAAVSASARPVQALDVLVVRLDLIVLERCQASCLVDRLGHVLAQVPLSLVEESDYLAQLVK